MGKARKEKEPTRRQAGERFASRYPFSPPDEKAYNLQKKVDFIHVEALEFPDDVQAVLPNVNWVGNSWSEYHGKMIDYVAKNYRRPDRGVIPRCFPGGVVSGPELSVQYIGSTAWEVFQHMLTIPQRVIDPQQVGYDHRSDSIVYAGKPPQLEYSPIAADEDWQWSVPQPTLQKMELNTAGPTLSQPELAKKKERLLKFLQNQSEFLWKEFINCSTYTAQRDRITRLLLELVQVAMSPFVRNPISEPVVVTARKILDAYLKKATPFPLLPTLFQIESSLMYAQSVNEREIVAQGVFGHTWIDVARTPVEAVRSTELVNEKRAVDEVANLVVRGWAPIITDERYNNTDGSHRGIAVRVWALLRHLYKRDLLGQPISSQGVQKAVENFVATRSDMSGLTLRETLRIAQALLEKPEYAQQRAALFAAVQTHGDIDYVPTILLREQEACCVVKNPFDQEGIIIGVDPLVTFTLTNQRTDLALGSRGPYHRTDKSQAPWFNVFALQPKNQRR